LSRAFVSSLAHILPAPSRLRRGAASRYLSARGEGRAAAGERPPRRLPRFAPLLFAGILLAACGSDPELVPVQTATPDAGTTVAASPGTCTGGQIASLQRDNQRSYTAPPQRVIDPAKTYTATMQTARGAIVIALAAADAPNTVNNFVYLACRGYFDGLTFHRVVKDPAPFVIQGGDPRGDGRGGPGYVFADEFSPNLRHDAAGVISMANSGANTNGSQFFITLAAAPHLDDKHSAFGRVTEGMTVANAIREGDKILAVSIAET
jgi:cyclophilin family peptidyl-prolyl cis-trans isomerase